MKLREAIYSPLFTSWLNTTLAVSNISLSYQLCLNASDENLFRLYYYIAEYQSIGHYMIFFIPNLLSYAFVFNQWMDKIQELKLAKDDVGLVYLYAVIIRKVVFFPIANLTLNETEIIQV